jgi:hypothetical protein
LLFLLFLQEIISDGRFFSAGILERRRRRERKNSDMTAPTSGSLGTRRREMGLEIGMTQLSN